MGRIVATALGIKGTDANGDVFGILYSDIDRISPNFNGSKIILKDGYLIRVHQSYDEVSMMLAQAQKDFYERKAAAQ